ncbi:MAG: hypothetical protein ACRC5M_03660, partial [Anaeroplasmataceae bacterium]
MTNTEYSHVKVYEPNIVRNVNLKVAKDEHGEILKVSKEIYILVGNKIIEYVEGVIVANFEVLNEKSSIQLLKEGMQDMSVIYTNLESTYNDLKAGHESLGKNYEELKQGNEELKQGNEELRQVNEII